MQTHIDTRLLQTDAGKAADDILRSCVHCGFCTATCPTYQLLGDELDSPRGRIYLIKQALEGQQITRRSQLHLDRCLSCRSCETTCPSGVQYASLLEIGRHLVDQQVQRSVRERLLRWGMKSILPYPSRLAPLVALASTMKPLLPRKWRQKIPQQRAYDHLPVASQPRKVILFAGCVQSVVARQINQAAARVLERLGIQCIWVESEQCCGAVNHHLGDRKTAVDFARRNIDLWNRHLEDGAEAIIGTASACILEIREYAQQLQKDPDYATKAQTVSEATLDIGEYIQQQDTSGLQLVDQLPRVAFHAPCTLQHGLQLKGRTEQLLRSLGFSITEPRDAHLCCGSAGTYSILQPRLATRLRSNKLEALTGEQADLIATANIGCLLHLQEGTATPVRHWIEVVAESLTEINPSINE
ncbi:MAG: glycolate oxidase subunit GlcF [Pseudomonadota bacterium]